MCIRDRFYTMLMIVLRIKVEVIELLRAVLNNMFVSHAGGRCV